MSRAAALVALAMSTAATLGAQAVGLFGGDTAKAVNGRRDLEQLTRERARQGERRVARAHAARLSGDAVTRDDPRVSAWRFRSPRRLAPAAAGRRNCGRATSRTGR